MPGPALPPGDQTLNGIYVRPGFQGRGIGKALMTAAFEQSRFANATHVYLAMWEKNKSARILYLKCGFEIVGTKDVVINGKIIGEDLVLRRPGGKSF